MDEHERYDLAMQHAVEQHAAAVKNARLVLLKTIAPVVAEYYHALINRGVKPRDAATLAAAMQTILVTGGKTEEK